MSRPRSSSNAAGPHRPSRVRSIPRGQLWPLSYLHSRCGYGPRARAAMIAAGLPVIRYQRRAWISTTDLIAFLTRVGRRPAAGEGAP